LYLYKLLASGDLEDWEPRKSIGVGEWVPPTILPRKTFVVLNHNTGPTHHFFIPHTENEDKNKRLEEKILMPEHLRSLSNQKIQGLIKTGTFKGHRWTDKCTCLPSFLLIQVLLFNLCIAHILHSIREIAFNQIVA
jgi:hypothetical protein